MTLSISRDEFRTSVPKNQGPSPLFSDQEMEQAVRTLLLGLGEDPNREEGSSITPNRVVKALKFLTSGYHQSLDELLNGAVFHENTNEMVLVRDIDSVLASCEHHISADSGSRPCRLHSRR